MSAHVPRHSLLSVQKRIVLTAGFDVLKWIDNLVPFLPWRGKNRLRGVDICRDELIHFRCILAADSTYSWNNSNQPVNGLWTIIAYSQIIIIISEEALVIPSIPWWFEKYSGTSILHGFVGWFLVTNHVEDMLWLGTSARKIEDEGTIVIFIANHAGNVQ